MKKLFKKATATLLCVMMLLSCVWVQGFAALDSLKMPEITAVEIVGEDADKTVSMQEIKYYYENVLKEIKEMAEDMGLDLDLPADFEEYLSEFEFLEDSIYYNMRYSGLVEYDFEVTLSNGDKVTIKNGDYSAEYKKIFFVYVDAYVTYEDYIEAKESGADTITITLKGEIENNILDFVETNTATFEKEVPMAERLVKSFSVVSGFPKKVYEYCDYYDVDGAKFKVTFADGTTKTLKAEKNIDPETKEIYFTLDGEELYIYEGDNNDLEIFYLDIVAKVGVEYYDDYDPFESIEITDYVFDETVGLTSISYDITFTDGDTKSYTKEFEPVGTTALLPYGYLDYIEGFCVVLSPYSIDYDGEYEAGYLYFTVSAGEEGDSIKVEFSATQEINILVTIMEKLADIIDFIRSLISSLFNF